MNPFELTVQRRLTKAFIDTMPVELVLTPNTLQRTSTGGRSLVAGVPRAPQTLRLVEPGDSAGRPAERASEGVETRIVYMLIGEHDAEMDANDTFTHDGDPWHIDKMMPDNGWERRAVVVRDV